MKRLNLLMRTAIMKMRSLSVVGLWILLMLGFSGQVGAYSEKDLAKLKTTLNCVKCDLSGADFMLGINLEGANLHGADLREAFLWDPNFDPGHLAEEQEGLFYSTLRGIDFSEANLTGAYLERADLTGANLKRADLTRVDLTRVNLSGANLAEANLAEADLSEADLSGANLAGADLSGADLTDANLKGAKMRGAILCNTTMPDGSVLYTGC